MAQVLTTPPQIKTAKKRHHGILGRRERQPLSKRLLELLFKTAANAK